MMRKDRVSLNWGGGVGGMSVTSVRMVPGNGVRDACMQRKMDLHT